MKFTSRRSPVFSRKGLCASSQPLASSAGISILQQHGNAADAAVAMAACLAVSEPCSTGIGGDCFVLYFDAQSKKVSCLLGNGASSEKADLNHLIQAGYSMQRPIERHHPYSVTVPGAPAAWVDVVSKLGSGNLSMEQILEPAIDMAQNGVPISPITAHHWKNDQDLLKASLNGTTFLIDGRAPEAGELFTNPDLANTLRLLARQGKKGFYEGVVGQSIVEAVTSLGGVMTLNDLKSHESEWTEPLHFVYHGVDVFEVPPPTHGIVALIALNISQKLQEFDENKSSQKQGFNSTDYLHDMICCMQWAFEDAAAHIACPRSYNTSTEALLSVTEATSRAHAIHSSPNNCPSFSPQALNSFRQSETVQFCAVDGQGNACSMINSNYMGFGTGIVPAQTGFTLQNRGLNFNLDPQHPNCYAPRKRPYHTIIPGLATKDGELYAAFGVMGGFMQPQGHMQVLRNMIDFGMGPQEALDAPRFCIEKNPALGTDVVFLEEGITESIVEQVKSRGHNAKGPISGHARSVFGRGQIIKYNAQTKIFEGGSDPRADGQVIGL